MLAGDQLGLNNKVAIVTGGASGIGRATVELFVSLGTKVVIADINEELGPEFEKLLREKGYEAFFCLTNIADPKSVESLVSAALEQYKTIDFLVNCAAVSGLSAYVDLIEEEWDWTLEINLKGTHLMCLAVTKIMLKKGIKGRIVNISSINDQIPVVGVTPYVTSKAAITGLTRSLALELAPYGINVNAVRPGGIDTPMMKEILELPDLAQALLRQIPRGRIGRPEDVARVIIFLVSELAEWVTGAEIPVSGGMHLVGEASYNYYFEKEMQHEDKLPDVPFARPWKKYNLKDFRES
ncbi:MAG: SDR family NAD(P)-dependent oxidoreductase [Candidatus Hodarchaeota archaeon]